MHYIIRPKRELGLEQIHFIPSILTQMKTQQYALRYNTKSISIIRLPKFYSHTTTITHILAKHKSKKIFPPQPLSFGHREDFFSLSTQLQIMH